MANNAYGFDIESKTKESFIKEGSPIYYIFKEHIPVFMNPIDYNMVVEPDVVEERNTTQDISYDYIVPLQVTSSSSDEAALLSLIADMPGLTGDDEKDELILKEPVRRQITPAMMAEALHSGLGFTFVDWEEASICYEKVTAYLNEINKRRREVMHVALPPEEDMDKLAALSNALRGVAEAYRLEHSMANVNLKMNKLFLRSFFSSAITDDSHTSQLQRNIPTKPIVRSITHSVDMNEVAKMQEEREGKTADFNPPSPYDFNYD